MNKFLELIKRTALEVIQQSHPMELLFAVVTQEEDIPKEIPLIITVEQKKPLTRNFFVESRNLNGLKKGEKLILLQVQGGQQFYILEVLGRDTD